MTGSEVMGHEKVLVTGGSGFMGTNLVDSLIDKGMTVLNIDINPPKKKQQDLYWKKADICHKDTLTTLIHEFNPNYVIHLAARTDMHGKKVINYDANTVGVSNMIHACKSLPDLKRVIFASSRLVCQIGYIPSSDTDYNADTAYGLSKVSGEKIVRSEAQNDLPWIIFRPTSIWGPWFGTPYRDFFDRLQMGHYVHPTTKPISKSFGYIENTIFQIEEACFTSKGDQLLHTTEYLCDTEPLEVLEWANMICAELNVKKPMHIPYAILKIAALCGDVLSYFGYKSAPITSFRLNNLLTSMVYPTKGMEILSKDMPFTLHEGVKKTVSWLRDNDR